MGKLANFPNLHELRLILPREVFKVYQQYFTNALRMNPDKPFLEHSASLVAWMAIKRMFKRNQITGHWERRAH